MVLDLVLVPIGVTIIGVLVSHPVDILQRSVSAFYYDLNLLGFPFFKNLF